jgi:hypothetical protein
VLGTLWPRTVGRQTPVRSTAVDNPVDRLCTDAPWMWNPSDKVKSHACRLVDTLRQPDI